MLLQYRCSFNLNNTVHRCCNTGTAPDPVPQKLNPHSGRRYDVCSDMYFTIVPLGILQFGLTFRGPEIARNII
jgi:hypothetical protein